MKELGQRVFDLMYILRRRSAYCLHGKHAAELCETGQTV